MFIVKMPTFKYKPTATFQTLQNSEVAKPNQSANNTYTNILIHYTTLWNVFTGRAVDRSALAMATTPLQFIAGLGCFWKCGPMWFTISLDPPPST